MRKTTNKNSKKTQNTTLPAVAPAVVTSPSLNVQSLQALGVDMKVSKADLMEYIANQIEDQLRESKENLWNQMTVLVKDRQNRVESHKKSTEDFINSLPKAKAYNEARKNLHIVECALSEKENEFDSLNYKLTVDVYRFSENGCNAGSFHCGFETRKVKISNQMAGFEKIVDLYEVDEYKTITDKYRSLQKDYQDINNKLNNLNDHVKSARIAMLKSILGGTEEGKVLLNFLNSRIRNFAALVSSSTSST